MKLVAEKSALSSALSKAVRAVGRSGWGPAVAALLVEATEGGLSVTGTDGDLRIRVAVDGVTVHQPGTVAVPGKLLADLAKAAPGETVTLEVTADDTLAVVSGRMRSTLHLTDADDFPIARDLGDSPAATVSTTALFGAITQVASSAADDQSRPMLTGVLCESRSDGMRLIATDSYRLSVAELPKVGFASEDQIIVPARALSEAARLFDDEAEVTVTLSRDAVVFSSPTATLHSSLIQGAYPAYQTLVDGATKGATGSLSFDVAAMTAAVKRVALVCDSTTPVRLGLSPDGIAVSAARSEIGTADEKVDGNYTGPEMAIGLNPRYLLESLEAIGAGTVTVALSDDIKPLLLRPSDDDTFVTLLMPVRL